MEFKVKLEFLWNSTLSVLAPYISGVNTYKTEFCLFSL